jgi:hypothetical protein
MNGKLVMMLTLTTVMLAFGHHTVAQEELESLRGTTAIEDLSATPESSRWKNDRKPVSREFVQQPPPDSAFDQGLPDQSEVQQVPQLPQLGKVREIRCDQDQPDPFQGSRWK